MITPSFNIENKFFIFKNVISYDYANSLIKITIDKIKEDEILNKTDEVIKFPNHIEIDISTKYEFRDIINQKIAKYIESIYDENIIAKQSGILFYKENHHMIKHRDGGPLDNVRICTSVLYLNDKRENESGGDVICYDENENIIHTYTPETGDLIIFDSFYNKNEKALLHSVNTIQNWERFVYRTYWEKTEN